MKKLYKNTKINWLVLIASCLATFSLWAKPVAVVSTVDGNVFSIYQGVTKALSAADHIPDLAEIVTEEGAQITFADYYDHKFHVAGSGHVKITGNVTELLAGYIWVQSFGQSVEEFIIQTANSVVTYKGGEAIVSYDKVKGKTQLYSLSESFEIAHVLEKSFKEVVDKGQFTFIDNDFENGAPRRPTELGHASYEKMRSLFYKVHPIEYKHPTLSKNDEILPQRRSNLRIPASVLPENKVSDSFSKESKIIYLLPDTKKNQAKKDQQLESFYKGKVTEWSVKPKKKKFVPSYDKLSGVEIKIYGQKSPLSKEKNKLASVKDSVSNPVISNKKESTTYRLPSSVSSLGAESNSEFESSLTNEFKKQMRHSNEVNSLIRDLKNYNQDYREEY